MSQIFNLRLFLCLYKFLIILWTRCFLACLLFSLVAKVALASSTHVIVDNLASICGCDRNMVICFSQYVIAMIVTLMLFKYFGEIMLRDQYGSMVVEQEMNQ